MAVGTSIASIRREPRVDVASVALSTLVLALLACSLAFVGHRLSVPSDGTIVGGGAGNPYADGAVTIGPSLGHAAATQVQAGDRVIQLMGRPIDTWLDALGNPAASRPVTGLGDAVSLAVVRAGRTIEVTTTAAPFDPLAALREDWGAVVLALSIQIVGIYLFMRRPKEPAARALLITGTGMFASTVPWALGLQITDIAHGAGFWLHAAATGLAYALFWCGAIHFALVFPRPIPFADRPYRVLLVAYAIPIAALISVILGAWLVTGRVQAALEAWLAAQGVLEVAIIPAAIGLMGYSYWRLVDPVGRRQLRLVAGAAALAAVSSLFLWFGPQLLIGTPLVPRGAVALLGLPFPIALALAVSRYHLFDLDVLVNRSLVYGGLTAGVVATYAATVAAIGGFIPGNAPFAIALLAAGAVAVVALPLRDRLQRSVNRFMYGDREDPDGALRRLGRRLEASLDPQTVLSTLVQTVAESLRSPFVAIELERNGDYRVEAAHGTVPLDQTGERDLDRLPIVYRGQPIGRLVVCPRDAFDRFTAADERLVADLARQAGPAVEAVRLTADLRRSREALVTAREEERRRLRRDLHDELGPAMAGSLMKLSAARNLMAGDADRARGLLDDLEGDVRGMIGEVRRITHNLRPPALDELGLLGVLRIQVAAFDGGPPDREFHASLEAPDELPPLPAAVEVAGLRIALEGLTNAARHSGASHAEVSLAVDGDALIIAVHDDGKGIPEDARPGVGLSSMRERADELGGSVRVESPAGRGTTVTARLPVAVGPS
jgi:signal transduction histidine kinase